MVCQKCSRRQTFPGGAIACSFSNKGTRMVGYLVTYLGQRPHNEIDCVRNQWAWTEYLAV